MLNHLMVDQNDVLDDLLLYMPGVQVQSHAHRPTYTINGRLFCAVTGQGIVVRLPEKRVRDMIALGEEFGPADPAPGENSREWLCIQRDVTHDYGQIIGLFEEAIYYSMMTVPQSRRERASIRLRFAG
jgi:hypothetical protein